MFENLRQKYIQKQRKRIEESSKLYSRYSILYHEFVIVRDLHVHLAGSTYSVHSASDFAADELKSYRRAMDAAAKFFTYAIDSYDIDMVVPCRNIDIQGMTRERINNEFLTPIHPDISNFVCTTVHPGAQDTIEVKLYPDLFKRYSDIRKYSTKMKCLFFRYYPRYSVRPTAFNRMYTPNNAMNDIGVLEGPLIFSKAEHAGCFRKCLQMHTVLSSELIFMILQFLFPKIMRTFSNGGGIFFK